MSRTSTALRRLGVAAIAATTLGVGVAALAPGPALAGGPTSQLSIAPTGQTSAAGTCQSYTVTATDSTGAKPSDTPTVTVSLTQNPAYAGTIAFCDPTKSSPPGSNGNPTQSPATGTSTTSATTSKAVATTMAPNGTVSATFGVYSSAAGNVDVRAALTANASVMSNIAKATFTATPASPSPTATPRPTGTTPPGNVPLNLRLDSPSTITPGIQSRMTATGSPNAAVVLRCYSRTPQNATQQTPPYFDARSTTLGANGVIQFVLLPGTNTRCFVKYAGTSDSAATVSASVVQNVATALSLSAYRDGVRLYHFQGTNLPRRAGQLITLYRYATATNGYCVPMPESYTGTSSNGCQAIRTATAFTDSTNVWRINRSFTGSGQFYFVARTSNTLTNVAGFSNQRLTIIH